MMWATVTKRMPTEVTRHFKETLRENIEFGQGLTIDDVADANLNRTTIFNNMVDFFGQHDVLACPVVGNMPRPQSVEWVPEVAGVPLSGYMDWLRFAFLATVTGLPAMSVPIGLSDERIPVGVQLIGQPRGEARLLAAARAVEVAMGGPMKPIDPVTPTA
jgi:amidase